MKKRVFLLWMAIPLLMSSCFKEDEPVTPHDPGNVTTTTIALTADYKYQVYFDLGTNKVISTNEKKEWDLGFQCSENGWHIILNTSNFMKAAHSGLTDFMQAIDTSGMTWKFDPSSGNLDSTAIGNWLSFSVPDSSITYSNEVYFIDRGYDEAGNLRGFRKIAFNKKEGDRFIFKYANLDGTEEKTDTIIQDPDVNFVFYNFQNGGRETILEPGKYDYDLLFSQYTTLLFTDAGEPYPYLVTGVLSNRTGVVVARDTIADFQNIDLELAKTLIYSKTLDEIGYNWKDITGDVGSGNVTYVIVPKLSYIILDHEGYYYKLRFISFYNNQGEKGYPTFEFQRL